MTEKSPPVDSIILPIDQEIEFSVEYSSSMHGFAEFYIDGEREVVTHVHRKHNEWTWPFSSSESGSYRIDILVRRWGSNSLLRLLFGKIYAHATWEITVVDGEVIHQRDPYKLKELIQDMLSLYTLGVIGRSAIRRFEQNLEAMSEDSEDNSFKLTTLDEFQQLEEKAAEKEPSDPD